MRRGIQKKWLVQHILSSVQIAKKGADPLISAFAYSYLYYCSVAMLLAEGYPAGDHEDCGGEDSYLDKWWVEDHAGGKSYNFYQQINPQVFLCKIYVSAGSTSGVVLIKTRLEPVQIGCRYDYDQAVCSLDHAACTPVD